MSYQLKIELRNVDNPSVWRRIIVPEDITLEQLIIAINACFGWSGSRLSQFTCHNDKGEMFELYDYMRLGNILNYGVTDIVYLYAFGDDDWAWVHDITVEKTVADRCPHAVCTEGRGACPPEGCGDPIGYKRLKYILYAEPDSEDAKDEREWLGLKDGEEFDDDHFTQEDINRINKILEDHVE